MAFDKNTNSEVAKSIQRLTDFVNKVQRTRAHQKAFFSGNKKTLAKSKQLERELDDFIPVASHDLLILKNIFTPSFPDLEKELNRVEQFDFVTH